MASIKEVADAAGVSTATVSRVLAGTSVRPGVRETVLAVVQRLDYRPNRAARSLRSARTTTLGLVVADIQNPYFTEVSRAVEDVANRAGYSVFLCNSDENPEKETTYLRLLRDENAAGVIVAPTAEALKSPNHNAFNGLPTVVIDRPVSRGTIDTVVVDNSLAAEELTQHLISQGARRIAGLFGNHSATGRARHEGFVARMRRPALRLRSPSSPSLANRPASR
ncbi:MAG: LacI family DNA-binding transcriptional regulator [Tepidisphaeraceae bacterium]